MSFWGWSIPVIREWLEQAGALVPEQRALHGSYAGMPTGVQVVWSVEVQGRRGQVQRLVVPIGISLEGQRLTGLENVQRLILQLKPGADALFTESRRLELLEGAAQALPHRHLEYGGHLAEGATYQADPLCWIEVKGVSFR